MELGLTPDTRRAVETFSMIAATRAAGFTALGMVSGRFPADTRIVVQDNGLHCHELLGLQITRDRDATIAMARRLAADVAALDASWVLTTFDVGLVTGNLEEAMTRRALPGEGVLALDRFVSILRNRGWDGVVSMQILSDGPRALSYGKYARRVYDGAARYWD
jgi:sugar phosphate isomerase/epimerase